MRAMQLVSTESYRMSSVLQKKVGLAGGVPPTIALMPAFWERLAERVRDWACKALDADIQLPAGEKRAICGEEARARLDQLISYGFNAGASKGLCCLGFDTIGAVRYAAGRLGQAPDSLASASELFLRLLCEQLALECWHRLTDGLAGHDGRSVGLCERDDVAGGLADEVRYILVDFPLASDGWTARLVLIFDAAYLHQAARDSMPVAGSTDVFPSHGRSILNESVASSSVVLDAVLGRVPLTVAECARLEPGQLLPLLNADRRRLALCVETTEGPTEIGQGELGAWKVQRAIKLNSAISSDFSNEVVERLP